MSLHRFLVACSILVAFVASSAQATAVYVVRLDDVGQTHGGGNYTFQEASGATTQSLSAIGANYGIAAIAGPGGLGTYTYISDAYFGPGDHGNNGWALARSSLSLNDVVISGPGTGTVSGSLNIHLSGSLGISAIVPGGSAQADTHVRVNASVAGNSFEGLVSTCYPLGGGSCAFPSFHASGLLSSVSGDMTGATIDGVFSTGTIDLPLGTSFALSLFLESRAYAANNPGTEVHSSFLNTLSFPASGVVFNLPDGYTVNSVDGGIVNNGVSVVPLPGALPLFFSGLAALFGIGRRRARLA